MSSFWFESFKGPDTAVGRGLSMAWGRLSGGIGVRLINNESRLWSFGSRALNGCGAFIINGAGEFESHPLRHFNFQNQLSAHNKVSPKQLSSYISARNNSKRFGCLPIFFTSYKSSHLPTRHVIKKLGRAGGCSAHWVIKPLVLFIPCLP